MARPVREGAVGKVPTHSGRQLTSSLPHFAQPDGLLGLVRALRGRGCGHILCYSGYTYEALRRRAERQAAIAGVLDEIDMLVDGPYVAGLAAGAGPWVGSRNQRVLALEDGGMARRPAAGSTARLGASVPR